MRIYLIISLDDYRKTSPISCCYSLGYPKRSSCWNFFRIIRCYVHLHEFTGVRLASCRDRFLLFAQHTFATIHSLFRMSSLAVACHHVETDSCCSLSTFAGDSLTLSRSLRSLTKIKDFLVRTCRLNLLTSFARVPCSHASLVLLKEFSKRRMHFCFRANKGIEPIGYWIEPDDRSELGNKNSAK